ncbi:MAG: hypothetical protein GXX85_11060 [Ignavibacteria bacterium]|nr:hypothetical protein [Ignavibacteria bacterium]
MWNLDDENIYTKFYSFTINEAFTYGNMTEGQRDKDKRERIREAANNNFPNDRPENKKWAFRITFGKSGGRQFDVENVPKLIIDAFCIKQISNDNSVFTSLGLYKDDTIDEVIMVQVAGKRNNESYMEIEIFHKK